MNGWLWIWGIHTYRADRTAGSLRSHEQDNKTKVEHKVGICSKTSTVNKVRKQIINDETSATPAVRREPTRQPRTWITTPTLGNHKYLKIRWQIWKGHEWAIPFGFCHVGCIRFCVTRKEAGSWACVHGLCQLECVCVPSALTLRPKQRINAPLGLRANDAVLDCQSSACLCWTHSTLDLLWLVVVEPWSVVDATAAQE